jgi:hypothetical protein
VQRPRPYDASAIVSALQEHRVRFVVIGGVAAIAQGSPLPTEDMDVTPDPAAENLIALAAALVDLDAKLRTPEGPVDFPIVARMLSGSTIWTLTTRAGALDLCFEPSGTQGFDDLRRGALELDFGTQRPVLVASLLDVIRSKEAAGRPKDVAQLPALRQTLEVIREREQRDRRQR